MTDANVENLVLEHLRAIRATQTRHDQKFEDILTRLNHLERSVAVLRVEFAESQMATFGLTEKVDRLSSRVDRIEKRLELVD